MDPRNNDALVSKDANEYWQDVDLYIGGTEHATGHLIYGRFWNKFLYDLGLVVKDEPFKKLINQGMIQGRSNFVYRIKDTNTFVSYGLKGEYDVTPIHVDVNIVSNDILDLDKFRAWRPEFNDAEFILDNGKYECGYAVEKMSKSMFNVVNPDDIVERYGADTLRLYEMFLGPLEQSKPWDTNGIDGVNRFLKRLWGLFYKGDEFLVADGEPTRDELKSLHKLIKKVTWDIENFSFNTSIAAFMICVNELTTLKCHNREILSQLIVLLAPFAPHITEELWQHLGESRDEGESIMYAAMPEGGTVDETLVAMVARAREIISGVRAVRAKKNIPARDALTLNVLGDLEADITPMLCKLAGLEAVNTGAAKDAAAASFMVGTLELNVPLASAIDVPAEIGRLEKEIKYLEGFKASIEKKLSNERFVAGAPAAVVEGERKKLADTLSKLEANAATLAALKA